MKYVVVVAGGKGIRMGESLPKQFLLIGGKPILMHVLETFYNYDSDMRIILVLPESQKSYWKELCVKYNFLIPFQIAEGGSTRFESVHNGLKLVPDRKEVVLAVHDGVRPFVSKQVIDSCFRKAEHCGAVIPVIEVVDTIRHSLSRGSSKTVPRNEYVLVQTPQVFSAKLLKKAYDQTYQLDFTDDASVVEALGETIVMVPGNRENIKITTPYDLKIAEALLS